MHTCYTFPVALWTEEIRTALVYCSLNRTTVNTCTWDALVFFYSVSLLPCVPLTLDHWWVSIISLWASGLLNLILQLQLMEGMHNVFAVYVCTVTQLLDPQFLLSPLYYSVLGDAFSAVFHSLSMLIFTSVPVLIWELGLTCSHCYPHISIRLLSHPLGYKVCLSH